MENQKTELDYFTVADICDMLHVGRATATRLCNTEGFPCIKIGMNYRVNKEEFFKWMSENVCAS